MSKFWKRVVETKPELIGSIVYFSPTKKANLACIIRDDGTVSPMCSPMVHFGDIVRLADAWRNGEIVTENGTKLPTRVSIPSLSFCDDFFFNAGRRGLIRKSVPLASCKTGMSMAHGSRDGEVVDPVAVTEPAQGETVEAVTTPGPLINVLEAKKKQCPGFNRRSHQQAIAKRQWDGAQMEFSPVIFEGDRCRSKQCDGDISEHRSLCWACKKAKQRLWEARRFLKTATNEMSRIRSTNNRWLTDEEKLKKEDYLLEDARLFLRKKNREIKSLRKELDVFRPKEEANRAAIRSVVRTVDKEQKKVRSPVCQWLIDVNQICGYHASSIVFLSHHIRQAHFAPQLEMNKGRSLMEGREYVCEWKGCKRQAPFENFQRLRRHVATHSGNAKTEQGLALLREQMVNSALPPPARRWNKTKQPVLRQYKSRRTWERTRNMSQLPLPTGRSVLAWKNNGGVKNGVDWTILEVMGKIGKAAPDLCHGLLTFDEVAFLSVRESKKQLEPNGEREFGLADNVDGELARTVLVFQYVALFSKKRFAVNVAWFGCGITTGLDTDTLEGWLWDVMLALQRHGFRVHALVCDGHVVNRSLQKRLVEDAKATGLEGTSYAIDHPLTTKPDVRLFLFSDPSHAIKKLRNCWYNREMAFSASAPDPLYWSLPLSPDAIRWDDLVAVREWQQKYPRVDRRLTKKHLEMTNYSKMNVRTAVDVVSEPIEDVLIELDALGTSDLPFFARTRSYMRIGRNLWLAMNNRRWYFNEEDAKPIVAKLDWVSEELTAWRNNTVDAPGKFLTNETFEDVMLLSQGVPAFVSYVLTVLSEEVPGIGFTPKVISQDSLELTFGALRQRGGGTQNITVLSVAYNLRSINCNVLNEFMQMLNVDV